MDDLSDAESMLGTLPARVVGKEFLAAVLEDPTRRSDRTCCLRLDAAHNVQRAVAARPLPPWNGTDAWRCDSADC